MRTSLRAAATLTFAILIATACSEGDSAVDPPVSALQLADDVNKAAGAAKAVVGSLGEPAQLVNEFGQDLTMMLRSVDVNQDPDRGRLIVVDVRAESGTVESRDASEFELWCNGENLAFYGGTYEWQEMRAATFLEGTREFDFPTSCTTPELRATPLVGNGESVRWDLTPLVSEP